MTIDAQAILDALTLVEKADLLNGADFWHTKELPEHAVPSIMLTDGTYGLRKQVPARGPLSLSESLPATCFPPASGLASSWDPELVRRIGEALGDECRAAGVAVLLGPGLNLKRSPLCGRNFEYFSEDPLLTGRLAAAVVQGVQGRGVGATLKHFAANNQETDRLNISAEVDERTLREIYLRAFELAVKGAQPWAVMASYNRINGTYCTENHWLLTEVLRTEWGFDGVVLSDWGAVNIRDRALEAGLDLEMPSSGGVGAAAIVAAVRDGTLSEEAVDRSAFRLLQLVSLTQSKERPEAFDVDAHHRLALDAARSSVVLLKNDGALLPLSPDTGGPIAVIGEFARTPYYQGSGSSKVNPTRVDSALAELRTELNGRRELLFAPGFTLDTENGDRAVADPDLVGAAGRAAAAADVAIVFLGLPPGVETEAWDRTHLDLPEEQLAVLEAVTAANPNVVVVLSGGGVIAVSEWEQKIPVLLEGWLLGQAGGAAIAEILLGHASPSGKLAETIPLQLEHNPAFGNFPGENHQVLYGERLLVGYRWYDARRLPVSYPFGHGLTYTSFDYEQLDVVVLDDGAEPRVRVSVRLTNTGSRSGVETVQLYVSDPVASVQRPEQELRDFARVGVDVGQSTTVVCELGAEAFSFWHPTMRRWVVEAGDFEVRVGSSSRDIRLRTTITLSGELTVSALTVSSSAGEFLDDPTLGPSVRALLEPATLALLTSGSLVGELVRQVPLTRIGRFFPGSSVDEQQVAALMAARPAEAPFNSCAENGVDARLTAAQSGAARSHP